MSRDTFRRTALRAVLGLVGMGAAMFLSPELVRSAYGQDAQSCGCSAYCAYDSCSCSAAGSSASCSCGCSWGWSYCNCYSNGTTDPPSQCIDPSQPGCEDMYGGKL